MTQSSVKIIMLTTVSFTFQVESSQRLIRIVGMSATDYVDVAKFLKVNAEKGLFNFQPVPLHQIFIGIDGHNACAFEKDLNEKCYEKMMEFVTKKKQIMIFVHDRGETQRTAKFLLETLKKNQHLRLVMTILKQKFNISVLKVDFCADIQSPNFSTESQIIG